MKVFVDNDVILDVLLQRKKFKASLKVFELIEEGKIKGFTSAVIFTNTFYILSKKIGRSSAKITLAKLNLLLNISEIDQKIVDMAIASDFLDFEDGIQYFCALNAKLDSIVTRNKSDYKNAKIPVYLPEELISLS